MREESKRHTNVPSIIGRLTSGVTEHVMQNAHNIMTGLPMRLRLPVHRKALTDAFFGASYGSWWYMRGVMVSLLMRVFISTDSYCWEPRLSQDTASDLMTPGASHQGGWLDYLIWNLPYVTAELSMGSPLFVLRQLKPGVDECGRFNAEKTNQTKQLTLSHQKCKGQLLTLPCCCTNANSSF